MRLPLIFSIPFTRSSPLPLPPLRRMTALPHRLLCSAPGRAKFGRVLQHWCAVLIVVMLAGCAGLTGPRSVVIDNAELSRRMAAHFPLERRWLEAIDVELSNPRVSSQHTTGQMRVELDLRMGERLFRNSVTARVALDSRIRFDPSDHSLRLADPQIDAFKLDGERLLGRAGGFPMRLLAQWLDDAVVYRIDATQIERIQRQGLQLQGVEVVERGLKLQFEPRTRQAWP